MLAAKYLFFICLQLFHVACNETFPFDNGSFLLESYGQDSMTKKGPSINHVNSFLDIFDPPPPLTTILLNKAFVVIWIFGKPPTPFQVHMVYGWPRRSAREIQKISHDDVQNKTSTFSLHLKEFRPRTLFEEGKWIQKR